jgi:CelD/BcsL family acetyltransferase involved in cellulose biosynthesis
MLKPLSPSDSFRYDIRLYKTLDAFRALQPQWRVLSAAANAHCPFINFEYCELAVEQALASGAAIEVATVFGAQELLVLWPVAIVNKGMLRTAQSPGCGCGEEYGGPLIRDVRRDDLYHAAVHAIMRIHADVLVIPMLENGSALQRALDVAPRSWVLARLPPRWRAMPGYSIGLRAYPAWKDFLSTRHSTLRASLRSSVKRLRRQGDVSFGWCSSAHEAETVLRWLFENKRRWALARGIESSYLMDSRVCEFFITLARRIDPSSAPLVAFVKVNGQPVCASVNLVGARVVEYFITTYDETFRMFSVGNLLVEFIAEWAHANGRNFDFRPLHGDYKARWADRHSWYATRMVVLNPLGRLAELSLLWEQGGRVYRKMASVVARRLT